MRYGSIVISNLLTNQLVRRGNSGAVVSVVSEPPELPPALNPPVLTGTLLFPDATDGEFYTYDASGIFTGTVTGYSLVSGTMGSGLAFIPSTCTFLGVASGTVDLTDLSISANNADGTSATSNTDTLTVNSATVTLPITSTGITTDEGKPILLDAFYNQDTTDRGTELMLGLFANSSGLSETSVLADVVAITGGGYAPITLADVSWVVANGDASYPQQLFTAAGSAFDTVYGYYIYTTGIVPKLLHINISSTGTEIADTEQYGVEHTTSLAGGTNGNTTTEGIQVALEMMYNSVNVNRGTTLEIGLYSDITAFDETAVLASITELGVAGSYAAKSIANGDFTITSPNAVLAVQAFLAAGASYSSDVYGYFLRTTGTIPKLVHTDHYSGAPVTVLDGETYNVDLTNTAD